MMEFEWLPLEFRQRIDEIIERTKDAGHGPQIWQAGGWIATDILRKLAVEERKEAVAYLDETAPEIANFIRENYPHRVA